MSRIKERFELLKQRSEKALIPFLAAGFPDLERTKDLILSLAEAGADIIEIGVPFSDPLADGPTIQLAYQRALERGTSLKKVLQMVRELRGKIEVPLVLMSYYNLIYQYGEEIFPAEAVNCGVDGVIIPDLPPEEAENLLTHSARAGLDVVFLVAPTSNSDRLSLITTHSQGFIYYVSITGITGARQALPDDLKTSVARLKKQTQLPVAIGFGISTPEQVREASGVADGVIVGSALISLIAEYKNKPNFLNEVCRFISQLKSATTYSATSKSNLEATK
ncbi:MAG: tryptophan synthase subunit alpha [Candidatus Tectomicrobia bacterium]|uniref:Tryptophan synthase alpha chain n=1 Tax=Tectimicrobiota bacterium TaxID=2528274 RepID=A0A933GLA3_UNCTE|nr:tryptophan synthase subunit alpha [Candidatus Tectomicrobia bacterium]